jgi:hypothetical protein
MDVVKLKKRNETSSQEMKSFPSEFELQVKPFELVGSEVVLKQKELLVNTVCTTNYHTSPMRLHCPAQLCNAVGHENWRFSGKLFIKHSSVIKIIIYFNQLTK